MHKGFWLIHPYSSAKADMAPPSKRRKITKTKQNGTETRQRPLTQRQTKSIYRRNLDIQNVHVVNNEDTDSNRNNEGSHTEQLQSIPTIDYTLLAREIIKQQGLMNSNNSSAGVQALNNSDNTAETQSTSFQSVENVDNNVHNTETVTLLPPLRSDLLIGERNSRIIPPIPTPSTCLPSDVSSVAHVNRGHVSMPGPQERQLNKDDNPLFNIVDQIFNAEPAVTATSESSSNSTMAFKTTDRSTSLSITHLNHPAQLLLRSSLSQSARRLYKSLEAVLAEGQKASNVDIYLMWSNIERCRQIVEQLQGIEKNQFYSGILHHLEQTLNIHTEILQSKIKQLNGNETTTTDGAKKRKKSPACHEQDAEKNQRSRAIEETIVGKGGLSFDDIAGLKDAKQALREAIIMPLHYPHLFTGGIKPWKRILLYGPPGTGKSRLAQAISTEINSTFYCVSSSDLVSSWVGESEKLIKELFHHATNQKGRSVIFIDEIDSICRQRNSREEEHTRRVKTELLKQMEGADNSDSSDEIFLLCATNCPWELDTAFLRRYQKRIYIPLPGKEARIELMKIHTRENQIELSDEEWDQLSEKTEGYSGSDIANMMLESLFGPIRDLQISTHWKQREDGKFMPCKADEDLSIEATITSFPPNKVIPRNVEMQDFLNSVQSHGRTITDLVLRRFDDFTLSFGESG